MSASASAPVPQGHERRSDQHSAPSGRSSHSTWTGNTSIQRRHLVLLAVALLCLAGTLVLIVMVASHPGPLPSDVGLTLWWQRLVLPQHALTSALEAVSTFTFPQPEMYLIATIIAIFGLALRRLDMLLALAVLAVADGTNFLLNALLHRPRPFGYGVAVVQHITTDFSFPSGHVEHVVAFLGIVVFLSFQVVHPLAWWQSALLWVARVALLATIVLMLPSRVLEGEHWPSDGLAGLLYGGFWLCLAILAYDWAAQRWPQLLGIREPRPATAPMRETVQVQSGADAPIQPTRHDSAYP